MSNEISSNKGSRSIEVYFPILFYKYFRILITGRLMEDGRLIGGLLMEVELYTEWDDNHVYIINQWKGWDEILHDGLLSLKKSPANWKILYNTALLNSNPQDKWRNTRRSKVKQPRSSSITLANAIPTSVINSRVALMVRLICHNEKVYEEVIFCKTSQYKSQLHFPSHNNRTCTKLTYKQQSTLLPRRN